jgi:hypothetical protein
VKTVTEHGFEYLVAEEGEEVSFFVPDPDFPKQKNRIKVRVTEKGRLEVYCEHSAHIIPTASNVYEIEPRRKWR